jgi:GNAT superfamily N-acetyltransferase
MIRKELALLVPSEGRVIVETDSLTEEQRQHLFYFEDDVFSLASYALQWEPKVRFFQVYESGKLVANAGLVGRTVMAGGHSLSVAGLGSVVCRPEARGKGHARAAVTAAIQHARDSMKAPFGMLFCLPRLVPFYERMGWARLDEPVLIEQSAGTVRSPLEVMVKLLGDRAWPPGPVSANGRPW